MTLPPEVTAAIGLARAAWRELITKLNALSSMLLAYVLAYPGAFAELKAQLPEPLASSMPLIAPAAWFVLIQFAKAKAVKTGVANAAAQPGEQL